MLRDLLADSATRGGDRTFFRHGGRTYSYAEAQDRALDLAQRLHGRGIQPGERLAIDLPNGPDLVFALLAGPMLGISFFLLNTRLTAPKKAELLDGFEVSATVDEEFLATLRSEAPVGFEPPDPASDDVFVRMFTSGTTGLPKAARLTYGALEAAARASAEVLMTPESGCWQLTLPMFHVGGLQVMIRSLVNGSPFILYDRFDAAAVLADVASGEATHVSVVDRTLRELIACDRDMLARYEAVLLGGGPVNERTLEDAAAANVWASYGMTETCGAVAVSAPGRYAEGLRPLPGCEVRIVGPAEDGCGEIAVSGPSVFSGYEPRRGEPASPARSDGAWFLTGDEGRIVDGGLFVSERTCDVFISGGENVYPAEIEREILAVGGVESAAVIGVEDPDWGRRPVAFAAGAGADRAAIVEHLERRLTSFQRPDAVFV
ncbi:MAG: 2-succinylbenzoate--CoA ligase, partial [Actinobacteria bacterium]